MQLENSIAWTLKKHDHRAYFDPFNTKQIDIWSLDELLSRQEQASLLRDCKTSTFLLLSNCVYIVQTFADILSRLIIIPFLMLVLQ